MAAVRDAMGPSAHIRVDANGARDVDQASDALAALAAYGIEYAEQPCATVAELRRLRIALARRIEVPIAADESIRKAEDPLRVAGEEAADLVVVKVAPSGGVRRALDVVAACGLPAVVSSALDTSVGMAAGVALAARSPSCPSPAGWARWRSSRATPRDSSLVPERPPAGAPRAGAADPALLERWAAPEDRRAWWLERVAALVRCRPARRSARLTTGRPGTRAIQSTS